MYLTNTYSLNRVALLVALPNPGDDDDPISSQRVDYINRPEGFSAGSGDVLISHVNYSPVDDDIRTDFSALCTWFGYDDVSLTSVVFENLSPSRSLWRAERSPHGCKLLLQRNSSAWEGQGMVYKWYKSINRRPNWWRLSFLTGDYSSQEKAEAALSSAYSTALALLSAVTEQYHPKLPPGFYLDYISNAKDFSVSIEKPHLELYNSRLDSFLESRQVYDPSIGESGVKASLYYKAYYTAIDKLPALQQNTFANIVECISTIASFLRGFDASDLKNAKKVAKDLWLQYRYSYSTTIGDMKEVLDTVARLQDIAGKEISTYGYASQGDYSVSCAVSLTVSLPESLNGWLRSVNLRPTLVNAWDMVPYSFVVDWFLKVGSILEDLQKWIDACDLQPSIVWYSVWHHIQGPGIDGVEYCRFSGKPPSLPYFSSHKVGSRTVGCRAADTVALFLL